MPKERKKVLCMDAQRHAEYYGMQQTFDELYAKSKAGEVFNGLMELVLSPDNIMLAYRNIKTNTGRTTDEWNATGKPTGRSSDERDALWYATAAICRSKGSHS